MISVVASNYSLLWPSPGRIKPVIWPHQGESSLSSGLHQGESSLSSGLHQGESSLSSGLHTGRIERDPQKREREKKKNITKKYYLIRNKKKIKK
jgi:hypothetical protein